MVCFTTICAWDVYNDLKNIGTGFSENTVTSTDLYRLFYHEESSNYGAQYEKPDFFENRIFNAIDNFTITELYMGANSPLFHKGVYLPVESAVLFYDAEGELIHGSFDNVMYFSYCSGIGAAYEEDDTHYGWMDLSPWKNDKGLYRQLSQACDNPYSNVIRVSGYFEGTQLKPVTMHLLNTSIEGLKDFDSELWQPLMSSNEVPEGKELATVYLHELNMIDYRGKPIRYEGTKYPDLATLTKELELHKENGATQQKRGIYKFGRMLVFSQRFGFYHGEDYASTATNDATLDFHLITAFRCSPLLCAMIQLRNVYIITGAIAMILFFTMRSLVIKHFIDPVCEAVAAMESGSKLAEKPNKPALWDEAQRLTACANDQYDAHRKKDNEIKRLKTALEYAKSAEENRRTMTSNIAHELKTPLAVIHSYAEGLKEHIAEDKRDKYLDIILSETERTDSLVLQMLDLSRLEAGRVKLARDEFSLAALTKTIFEKLEMAAKAKELNIVCDFEGSCTVVADESRIAQVVENFASNAVKYTPSGGNIAVKIRCENGKTLVTIENDSPPLPFKALTKVWNAFYRVDESHSGGGTGLGLAIAKNIVELHGGKCSVRNTKTGVEFGFYLTD
ncbi:MAG: HAMP domain-containing histidine kinase [Oscillospiraceae bacterium]|nr:HAMP domain-containing histidine kinase [Oscillospiraceae bacterium]